MILLSACLFTQLIFSAIGTVLCLMGIYIINDKYDRPAGIVILLVGAGFILGVINSIFGWVGLR